MSNQKYYFMRDFPKIFDLDYLATAELEEDDLYHLFETPSLLYSIIKAMYLSTNEFTSIKTLAKNFRRDNGWLTNKHFKTQKERDEFEKKLVKVIQNVYQYSEFMAKRWVDDWMFHYGFSIKH